MKSCTPKCTLVLLAAAALAVGGYFFFHKPEPRTPGEKLDAALDEIGKGLERASDEMQDKSAAEKFRDKLRGE